MFGVIIRLKCVCCMYGNATYIKVNYIRYDSYSQKYQGTSGQVLIAFDGIFFLPEKTLVFLLLADYHLKRMFKKPTIRHSYQFLNVPGHELHSWNFDDGSSILSGLVVNCTTGN